VFESLNPAQPEITDLIIEHDPRSLDRLPLTKQDVLEVFRRFNNQKALRAVNAIPDRGGILDPRAVDRLLLQTHWEMQRLSEEFYHGHRVAELLKAVIRAIRNTGFAGSLRVIDVGCGIGYTVRWLAAHTTLPSENVGLSGIDLNRTLVNEAARLATLENLPCRFSQGDAFAPAVAGNIYLSTGVIHRFRGDSLLKFLACHEHADSRAFLHFDFHPWLLASVGSWFFHILRMRTAIARHDGVLSAVRAHSGQTLTAASRSALPGFVSGIYGANIWGTPAPRVFQTLLGVRPQLLSELKSQLGTRRARLGKMQ
jgi:SAM-dependent methyltransferase